MCAIIINCWHLNCKIISLPSCCGVRVRGFDKSFSHFFWSIKFLFIICLNFFGTFSNHKSCPTDNKWKISLFEHNKSDVGKLKTYPLYVIGCTRSQGKKNSAFYLIQIYLDGKILWNLSRIVYITSEACLLHSQWFGKFNWSL